MDIIKIEKDVVDGQFVGIGKHCKVIHKKCVWKGCVIKTTKKKSMQIKNEKMININKNSVVNLQEDVVERNVMIITQNANGLVKLLQQNITGNVLWLKLVKVLKKKKML